MTTNKVKGKPVTTVPDTAADGSAVENVNREQSPDISSLVALTPDMYLNRELSWLQFNRRVLEEISKPATPLLERVKFAAIFAANLDEFFMIRVAGVKRKVSAGIVDVGVDGRTPLKQLTDIHRVTQKLVTEHARLMTDELIPALAGNGIEVVHYRDLGKKEKLHSKKFSSGKCSRY